MPDHYSVIRQYNDFEELSATLHGYDKAAVAEFLFMTKSPGM